jgi:hypothetical protein
MPPSYKDDYYADARAMIAALSRPDQTERLREALTSASRQCGNVIFNCEQQPASNERHLASWRNIQSFIDRALAGTVTAGNSGGGK